MRSVRPCDYRRELENAGGQPSHAAILIEPKTKISAGCAASHLASPSHPFAKRPADASAHLARRLSLVNVCRMRPETVSYPNLPTHKGGSQLNRINCCKCISHFAEKWIIDTIADANISAAT